MKKSTTKVLSIVLAVVMAFSCFAFVNAADNNTDKATTTVEQFDFGNLLNTVFEKIQKFFMDIIAFFKNLVTKSDPGNTPEQIAEYHKELDDMGIFANSADEQLPQTITHKLVLDHFAAPFPRGKTTKKAIVIGFDGCRADALKNFIGKDKSGVFEIAKTGAIYQTFSGGWPGREQQTATTAGWGCILTGGFASYSGLGGNNDAKKPEVDTFITTLAKQGHAATFDVSWKNHITINYKCDVDAAMEQGLPVTYTINKNDRKTYQSVLKHVTKKKGQEKSKLEDPDVIFLTLEYTDHNGHSTNFTNNNPLYVCAANKADNNAYNIVKAIRARTTYDTEDWLIIATTDHGGINGNHGGQSCYERCTWLAVNKPITNLADFANYEMT